jgi:D-tyrosyl-tRNA(Tyr) deacylase
MIAVVQRVSAAAVDVGDLRIGEIEGGLVVLVGVERGDTAADVVTVADKVATLRVFADAGGPMNRSVLETGGAILVVSQFTLCADLRRGRRPSLDRAAPPDEAAALIDQMVERFRSHDIRVAQGRFGARMAVSLVNDGPVTFSLMSRDGHLV